MFRRFTNLENDLDDHLKRNGLDSFSLKEKRLEIKNKTWKLTKALEPRVRTKK